MIVFKSKLNLKKIVWPKLHKILSILKKKTVFKTIVDKALMPFWKMFMQLKQLFNAQLLISILPPSSAPIITVVRYV